MTEAAVTPTSDQAATSRARDSGERTARSAVTSAPARLSSSSGWRPTTRRDYGRAPAVPGASALSRPRRHSLMPASTRLTRCRDVPGLLEDLAHRRGLGRLAGLQPSSRQRPAGAEAGTVVELRRVRGPTRQKDSNVPDDYRVRTDSRGIVHPRVLRRDRTTRRRHRPPAT